MSKVVCLTEEGFKKVQMELKNIQEVQLPNLERMIADPSSFESSVLYRSLQDVIDHRDFYLQRITVLTQWIANAQIMTVGTPVDPTSQAAIEWSELRVNALSLTKGNLYNFSLGDQVFAVLRQDDVASIQKDHEDLLAAKEEVQAQNTRASTAEMELRWLWRQVQKAHEAFIKDPQTAKLILEKAISGTKEDEETAESDGNCS